MRVSRRRPPATSRNPSRHVAFAPCRRRVCRIVQTRRGSRIAPLKNITSMWRVNFCYGIGVLTLPMLLFMLFDQMRDYARTRSWRVVDVSN